MLGIKAKCSEVTQNEDFDSCASKLQKMTSKTFHTKVYFAKVFTVHSSLPNIVHPIVC